MNFEYFSLIFFFDSNTIIYLLVGKFRLVNFNSFANYFWIFDTPFFTVHCGGIDGFTVMKLILKFRGLVC